MVAKELKEKYPVYPVVRRETSKGIEVMFKTLIRKRYNGVYYLIPLEARDNNEAKCIHKLHAEVYKELMLREYKVTDVKDDDQVNECNRLIDKI